MRILTLKSLKCFLFTVALTSLLTLAAVAQTRSLYERLGGKESIVAVVDEFAGRILADTRINAKFANSDPVRLKTMLVEQICEATGGPCKYTGRTMPASHAGMGVTSGEFNALVEDLVGALDKFNVPQTEKDELIGALAPMKAQIVEIDSTATGTPLPKKYKAFSAGKAGKAGKVKGSKGKKDKAAEAAPAEAAPAAAPAATEEKPAKGSKKKVKEEKPAVEEEKETKEAKKSKKKN